MFSSAPSLFVHGLNPYGWAHGSRTNENNVDLNRNYLDHAQGHAENPVYAELHELLTVSDVSCGATTVSTTTCATRGRAA